MGPVAVAPSTIPTSSRAAAALDRLPAGTVETGAASLASAYGCAATDAHRRQAQELLVAPLLLEPDWPDPTPPLSFAGGAVHADLIEDDLDTFAALRAAAATERAPSPEALADLAQACRLPVTPYASRATLRRRSNDTPATPAGPELRSPGSPPTPPGRVVDLSTHWAGPLATALLADAGWEVIKIDSIARPDGFRPRAALFAALNGAKTQHQLDLRLPDDRLTFERLVGEADLLVSSFSPRVLPNLGYGRDQLGRLAPRLRTLSISAFDPAGPRAGWVAYGPGVHAASGLADHGNPGAPRFRACPVAYPDALAGMAAFAAAVDPTSPRHVEVSLDGAIAPVCGIAARAEDGMA
ncbi:MAG: CoA transferase [Actinomycetota bacterium]